jgi:hypothetical protein
MIRLSSSRRMARSSGDLWDTVASMASRRHARCAFARTLRLLVDSEGGLSRRLADILGQQIQAHDVNALVHAQKYTFGRMQVKGKASPRCIGN